MADQQNPKFNILLEGPIGTGKTHACRTLITENLIDELFIMSVEPGIHTIMGDLPKDRVHWKYISPAKTDWQTMISNAQLVNNQSMEQLQKMQWPSKKEYTQFIEVLESLANFQCDRTGEEFGPVDEWGANRALVVDGLSGISRMAMDMTTGAKPIKTQPEWGVAMDNVRQFVEKCCFDTECTFVLLAHVTKEKDEVSGAFLTTVDTLGNKLAPQIPKPFDEVIMTKRERGKFLWSTEEAMTDLKARILEFSSEIEPNFKEIYNAYWNKVKELEG